MNTTQFIDTANWLSNIYSKRIQDTILSETIYYSLVHGGREIKDKTTIVSTLIDAAHELSIVNTQVIQNHNAVEIINAFNIKSLIDPAFPARITKILVLEGAENERLMLEIGVPLAQGWKRFSSCISPVASLIVPEIVRTEQSDEQILTLEVRINGESNLGADTISSVLKSANLLYISVTAAVQAETVAPLEAVYITSGSDFRFDLKGVGEAVKHIKNLFIEGWEKIRHRKSDDFRHNTKAALEGLHALDVLTKQRHLDAETKARIEHNIVQSMLDLFQAGALPREIQPVEVISNTKLMDAVQQRLLPAPMHSPKAIIAKKRSTKK